MKIEEVKNWLYGVRHVENKKRCCLREMEDIKYACETIRECSATVLRADKVSSYGNSNPTEDKAVKIVDKYQTRLSQLFSELEDLDLEIQKVRDTLNEIFAASEISVQEYETIFYFFFEGMSNEEVALASFYSIDMIYKLKASALRKIAEYTTD